MTDRINPSVDERRKWQLGEEACKVNVCLDLSPGFHADLWGNPSKNTHTRTWHLIAMRSSAVVLGSGTCTLTHRKSHRILKQTVPTS